MTSLRGAALLLVLAGCSDAAPFTGIWRVNCDDYWGVQIMPAGAGVYSVTFCGLSGCLERGAWMPDTAIAGDPAYEVVSESSLRIRRSDGGVFTYKRCSTNPAWKASAPR